ncbi:hypothetical protein STCU_01331 [Strigomonas culicis]|uniref:Uncharacterized protein n=1 Tax=Strigomonas culicis TaxID=28005 RepID=S9U9V8_9TRYP|nr:hypothetical protein STCU_06709 [Strigomonas culicis]EPY32312.1 hypothetical protein STCU_02874 [Strigomonas culicis]EPY32630.1 hypothetical protein STCU_02808 [Strigomonas culicis]EPY34771.1 hypothetical protein STCU_01331 [Strigomonas culicis]|eukprot:EPY25534.1 hypothetical protein STCU_06709 [Strigomonas culicis]
MAKETAKKNWKKNEARMKIFSMVTIAVNVLYVLVILYRNGGLPSFRDLSAISFWASQEYAALVSLKNFAAPRFSADGDLLDCIDASNPQELGYLTLAQDTLWVCWVVQTLCNLHTAFFVFYLPVPATFLHKLWKTILGPLLSNYFGSKGASQAEDSGEAGPRNRQERRKEEAKMRKAARRGA